MWRATALVLALFQLVHLTLLCVRPTASANVHQATASPNGNRIHNHDHSAAKP